MIDIKALMQELRNAATDKEREEISDKIKKEILLLSEEEVAKMKEEFLESFEDFLIESKRTIAKIDLEIKSSDIKEEGQKKLTDKLKHLSGVFNKMSLIIANESTKKLPHSNISILSFHLPLDA